MFSLKRSVVAAISLSGCITTSMQGYADRELPAKPVSRIVAYVAGPNPLVSSIQTSVTEEAKKRGLVAEDALLCFLPRAHTRTQKSGRDSRVMELTECSSSMWEIRASCSSTPARSYQGSTPDHQPPPGTINNFGNFSTVSLNGTSSGTMTATATPVYRYRRQTTFTARLIEPTTARNLWVGNGQVSAGGLLFVGDGANASSSVAAILDDLQQKGLIGPSS
jgi:hypothetical protein